MKLINKLAILAAVFVFVGCGKEFLETSPTDFLNQEDFAASGEKNPQILESTLNGLYSTMITAGAGGTGGHYDFGQKGIDIFTDMMSNDVALSVNTYGWYGRLTSLQAANDLNRNETYIPWRYYYKVIRSANLIIDGLGGNEVVPENDNVKFTLGQAKAMRAYAYFYLSQLFIPEYTPDSKVLPLYTNSTQPNQPQSTTKEVYDFMIKDLTSAIEFLEGYDRSAKSSVNQEVAKGLLAYVYASMGTDEANAKALELADAVIAGGNYSVLSREEAVGGFNDVSSNSWIWGVDLTTDMDIGLVSYWGQMDIFSYSYAWAGDVKSMDSDLYASISDDDVRKNQFYNDPSSFYYLTPFNKFYDPNRQIGGQRVVTTDYVFMRVEEFYLLSAELNAKLGNTAQAKAKLKSVLDSRVSDSAYVDALSGQELKDEIFKQTRIELWGEGKSYLSLKRNKETVKRGANHLTFVGDEFSYNDARLTWVIPIQEVRDNPFID